MKLRQAQLPEGWEIKKLGEVTTILGDGLHGTPIYNENGEYYFINGNNLNDGIIIFKENTKKVSYEEYNKHKKKLNERTILVSINGTLGNVAFYNNEKIILGKSACYFNIVESVDKYYIKHILSSFYFLNYANNEATGATIKNVSLKSIRELKIPLPPLPEQQRIVAILDKAFAAIAKAKANAQQNLKNAKALFESELQAIFENKGNDWEEKKLGEISEVKDGTHDSPKYIEEGIPFVTQKNIKPSGLTLADTKFIKVEDHEKFYKRSNVTYGDILISMIGANRGMAAIVDDKTTFSIKNVGLIKESENIVQHFLFYYLKSPLAMKYVLDKFNGGAQEFIGLTALRNFPIPFPTSPKEQQTIVHSLDALNNLEELKKSILQKAFCGELITEKEIAV